VTYQDVFPSILARSVGNWTGFGEMASRDGSSLLNEQESTERHLDIYFGSELFIVSLKRKWYPAETGPAFNRIKSNFLTENHYLAVQIIYFYY
jgi:hypothetical protein